MILERKISSIVFFILISMNAYSQDTKKDSLILFSGVIMDAKNLEPIPQVNIRNLSRRMGTSADDKGMFEFLANKTDTVVFSAMGYKVHIFVVPDTVRLRKYTYMQTLTRDTLSLPVAEIHPYPSYEELKEIVKKKTHDEILDEIVDYNMAPVHFMIQSMNYRSDAGLNYQQFVNTQVDNFYSNGQIAPQRIFDIFSWAAFIKAIKDGKFKRKKK